MGKNTSTIGSTLVFDQATVQAISSAVAQAVLAALGSVTVQQQPEPKAPAVRRSTTTPKEVSTKCSSIVGDDLGGRPCKGRFVEVLEGRALCSTHRRTALAGGKVRFPQTPKGASLAKPSTSKRPLDASEPKAGLVVKFEVVLDGGYWVNDGSAEALRKQGCTPSKKGQQLTMADVVRWVQNENGNSRGVGSNYRLWATFRVIGSPKPLTSYQVRYVLKNGSLRGCPKPATK